MPRVLKAVCAGPQLDARSAQYQLGAWHVVHVHHAVDSKGIVELHLLLHRWHRRDASTCPSSKRLLSVPVNLGMRYVAWVGVGKKYVK